MRRRLLALSAALLLPTAPLIHAQDEGVAAVRVRRTSSALTALAENQWAIADAVYQSGQYAADLDISLDGSIYHSNLMTYDLALQLGVAQLVDSLLETGAASPMVTGDLHLLTTWFQQKPISFSIYADHGESFRDYDMFDRGRIAETAFGGSGQWNNPIAPISVSLRDSSTFETRTDWSSVAREFSIAGGINAVSDADMRTRLDYVFSNFDRRILDVSDQTGWSHDFRLSNHLGFGPEGAHKLSTNLRFLDINGTLDSRIIDFSEALDLEHPFNLTSRYFYGLYVSGSEETDAITHHSSAKVTHQLYESLTTSLGGDARITTADQSSSWAAGPSLDLAYQKKIGIGTLSISYGVDLDAESRTVLTPNLQVFDEAHALSDVTVTLLGNTGVDWSSIVVTDASGTTVYTRIIDYELDKIGGRTRIARSPGGNIADGSGILVDYVTMDGQSEDLLRLGQTAEARVMLFDNRLAVYLRYLRERNLTNDTVSSDALDRLVSGISAELGVATVTGEVEYYGSAASPFTSYRIQNTTRLPLAKDSTLSFQGLGTLIQFAGANELSGNLDLEAKYDMSIGLYATLSAGAAYRIEGDWVAEPVSRWSGKASAEYSRGQFTCSLLYQLEGTTSPQMRQNHTLRLFLQREF